MITGAAQMDGAILVVSAADGPMPQTRDVMGETRVGPFLGQAAVQEWLTRFWRHQRDQRR